MSDTIVAVTSEPKDTHLWLEQTYDPKALSWAAARTAAAKATLSELSLYPQLRSELDDVLKRSSPTPLFLFLGDKLTRFRRKLKHPHGVLELAERDTEGRLTGWRTVFDVDAFNAAEGRTYELQTHNLQKLVMPPHYDRLLLPLAPAGGDEIELREFDLVNGTFIKDGFRTAASQIEAVWLNEDRLLIAHTLGNAPRCTNRWAAQAYLWDRGTAIEEARPILRLDPSDALMVLNTVGIGTARRGVITRYHDYATFSFVIINQDDGINEAVLPRKIKFPGFLAASERHVLVQLTEDADIGGVRRPAESLIAYDVHSNTADIDRATYVYTCGEDEFANGSYFDFAGTQTGFHFIAERRLRRRLLTARFSQGSWQVEERLGAPQGETLKLGFTGSSGNVAGEELLVEHTGYLTAPRFELLAPGKPALVIHEDAPVIDANAFTLEIRSVASRDGVEIDYYLLRPRTLTHPGATPTLMTGYGGFCQTFPPVYFAHNMGGLSLKLWLDRGGAIAVPAIRGGGERGEAWHSAAIKENRQKSYDDFIAAAEDLLSSGFTRPEHVGVFGSSHGGLLSATVGVQRPDLFGAVVSDVPTLDMIRYTKMGVGAGHTNEYGDPQDPAMHKAILGYSPYQNLRAGRVYPPFLVTVSTSDNRVDPGHSRKFAARAEEIGAKVLLIEEAEGGHEVSDPLTHPELMAMRMAFLIDALM